MALNPKVSINHMKLESFPRRMHMTLSRICRFHRGSRCGSIVILGAWYWGPHFAAEQCDHEKGKRGSSNSGGGMLEDDATATYTVPARAMMDRIVIRLVPVAFWSLDDHLQPSTGGRNDFGMALHLGQDCDASATIKSAAARRPHVVSGLCSRQLHARSPSLC